MKSLLTIAVLFMSVNVFAASGLDAVKIVLEQNEIVKLEESLQTKGFTLSKIEDVFATRGMVPRCPCTKLVLTFSRGMAGSGTETKKVFDVDARGLGTSLQLTIVENK
ncbi:MAG TPA: hypothetical protein VNJ08_05050 [Bacteriovoracaceae bacterium]|nr:hypothetical protein [Bacteriovoracaceae bacterium]